MADGHRSRLTIVALSVLVVAVLAGAVIAVMSLTRTMLGGKARNAAAVQAEHVRGQPKITIVSLTFDDAYEDQWRYAVPLLRSRHMNATFYVINSDSEGPYPCCMSFAQLRTLQGEGDDIGGHGVNHENLTDRRLSYDRKVADVCGSRMGLIRNGIDDPVSYAYPFGSFNSTAERIVARCKFTNARQGGGISSSGVKPAPPWAESLPPKHPEAVSTVAVDGRSPIQLSDLQNYVTAAAAHGGGWLPLTFHDVCDPYASDYTHCMSTYGPISDMVLGPFLGWLHRAGHPGGAPAGVVVRTMRWAMNTAKGPDTTPPSTKATCNSLPCSASGYGSAVRVSLPASDPGGVGVAKTYYTTDGSAPSPSSRVYQIPFFLRHSATVRFFSTDNAGNAEKVHTVKVRIG